MKETSWHLIRFVSFTPNLPIVSRRYGVPLGRCDDMNEKTYSYDTVIRSAEMGGAYVAFPYDIRVEFGKGRVKVHATFDGEPYDGSLVNMGVKNADGSVCYIIGIRKGIRAKIGKQACDTVTVTIKEQE